MCSFSMHVSDNALACNKLIKNMIKHVPNALKIKHVLN